MGQNERQKTVAGHCALDMCGSIACEFIRLFDSDFIEPNCNPNKLMAKYDKYISIKAREHNTSDAQRECYADCGFQDVCKRLEMVVRLRDLDMLSDEMDNRAYHRNERMGVCGAGTDDHECEKLEVDATGERADDSHECDDAGDSMGDAHMELWAGAGDLVGRGTYIPWEAYKGRLFRCEEVGYWPAKEDEKKYSFRAIEEKALEDFRQQNKKCHEWLMNVPMSHHQREEEIIRKKILFILDMCFGCNFLGIHDSETLIRRMTAEGFKVFSLEGYYKTESVYSKDPLEFRIDAFLDFSKIYVYNNNIGVAYNLCGNKMDEDKLRKIRPFIK